MARDAPPVLYAPHLTDLVKLLHQFDLSGKEEVSEPEPTRLKPSVDVAPSVTLREREDGSGATLTRVFSAESAEYGDSAASAPTSVLIEPAATVVVCDEIERAQQELTKRMLASKGDFYEFFAQQRLLPGANDVPPELLPTFARIWAGSLLHTVPAFSEVHRLWSERPPNVFRTTEVAFAELPLSIRLWFGPFLLPQRVKELDGGDSSRWERSAASGWMLPGAAVKENADSTGGVRRRREGYLRRQLIAVLHVLELLVRQVYPSSKGAGTREGPQALGMRAHSGAKIDPELVRGLVRQGSVISKRVATSALEHSADPVSADAFGAVAHTDDNVDKVTSDSRAKSQMAVGRIGLGFSFGPNFLVRFACRFRGGLAKPIGLPPTLKERIYALSSPELAHTALKAACEAEAVAPARTRSGCIALLKEKLMKEPLPQRSWEHVAPFREKAAALTLDGKAVTSAVQRDEAAFGAELEKGHLFGPDGKRCWTGRQITELEGTASTAAAAGTGEAGEYNERELAVLLLALREGAHEAAAETPPPPLTESEKAALEKSADEELGGDEEEGDGVEADFSHGLAPPPDNDAGNDEAQPLPERRTRICNDRHMGPVRTSPRNSFTVVALLEASTP